MGLKDINRSGYIGLPILYSLHQSQRIWWPSGLIEMLTQNIDYFKSKPLELPKITILVDRGYQEWKTDELMGADLSSNYDQAPVWTLRQAIKSWKGGFDDNPDLFRLQLSGVIESKNAWVERCKSLVKNFDRTLDGANAKLKLCLIGLLLKRLAAPPTP